MIRWRRQTNHPSITVRSQPPCILIPACVCSNSGFGVALERIQAQNRESGTAFIQRGRKNLEQACIQAVIGMVYPYVKSGKTIEVVCPAP